jgi:predicted nucleic acid-binding protein
LKNIFVLDACALIAFINNEPGFDNIDRLMDEAYDKNIIIVMNQVNLFEVYYHIMKVHGQNSANEMLKKIEKAPITIILGLSYYVMREAGRIKMTYNMSVGDSIAAAESIICNGTLVTSDYKDFEKLEQGGKIKVLWFR